MNGRGALLCCATWAMVSVLGWCVLAVLTAVWWRA